MSKNKSGPPATPNQPQGPGQQGVLAAAYSFTGPLPPPDALAAYNDIHPQLLERIVGMAERQAASRQSNEASAAYNARLGVVFAFILAIGGLGVTLTIALLANPWAGVAFGAAELATLVGVFIHGTKAKHAARHQA